MRRLPIALMAGLGAFAAAGGILALFALLVWMSTPRPGTSGIDMTNAWVTYISVGAIILALVIPHLIFGLILFRQGRETR
ncbi:MAG TPA: hypothetical protein VJ672_04200 [Gemmatimonadaceae bacterium]|nr:hypothetical protein [Gemmatimonadaceae bacterium]